MMMKLSIPYLRRMVRDLPLLVLVLGSLLVVTACRTPAPAAFPPPPATIPPEPAAAAPTIVHPTKAVTNSLQHVTYSFDLPRPSSRGYIIEESVDGEEWFVYGRSTAANLRQVTVVDATPNSGKQWRVTLP
jgi:hypothetical protein